MAARDKIYAAICEKNKKEWELAALGFTYETVQKHLKALLSEGLIYEGGKGARKYYTARAKGRAPIKRGPPIVLPDLPPIMLQWGGYTDIEPDPRYAVLIEGVQ